MSDKFVKDCAKAARLSLEENINKMVKLTKIQQRVFSSDKRFIGFELFEFSHNGKGLEPTFTIDTMPDVFDTIIPQTVYIVLQQFTDPHEFLDESKPGKMLTVSGFRVVLVDSPFMFVASNDGVEIAQELRAYVNGITYKNTGEK